MESSQLNTAIVTGGSSGIGKATVQALAESGFAVAFTYRSHEAEALAFAAELEQRGHQVTARLLDLADASSAGDVIDQLVEELGGVYALVNNAGVNPRGSFLETPLAEMRSTFEVNVAGPMACAQAAARHMIAQGSSGRIINVTSVLASAILITAAAYCTSKAALDTLTRVMAGELVEHGILVNSVAPGHTATPMAFGDQEVDPTAIRRESIPIRRPADPREVAAVIRFLASPEASYLSGASLLVDGGLLLRSGPEFLEREISAAAAQEQKRG